MRKSLSESGSLSKTFMQSALPKKYEFGAATDNNDCLYDAAGQSLKIVFPTSTYKAKSLRVLFSNYLHKINQESPKNNWLKEAIEKDGTIDDYEAHLATVQYTQEEMTRFKEESNVFTGYAIWGKPHIEGRVLAELFEITIHLIEFHESENNTEIIEPAHILVSKNGIKQVEQNSVNYQDARSIHLAVYRNHFVPILPVQVITPKIGMTFHNSSPELLGQPLVVKPKAVYFPVQGKLHGNKRDFFMDAVAQNPDLAGQVCELSINNHCLKIIIEDRFPTKAGYKATLWVNKSKVEGVFTIDNDDPILCTKFYILEINDLEDFVKNVVNSSLENKKRKLSYFFVEQQNESPKIAKFEVLNLESQQMASMIKQGSH